MGLISKIMPESGGEIWIWEISEEESFYTNSLKPETLRDLSQFASHQRKMQYMAIRYLLKLAGHGEEIHYDENRKPFLRNGAISISHTPAVAGIYLADKGVGLDIEAISKRVVRIAGKFLSEQEKIQFGMNDEKILTLLWGCKEAVFKKYGGETTHFSNNIIVDLIDQDKHEIHVKFSSRDEEWKKEILSYQIHGEIVTVFTL